MLQDFQKDWDSAEIVGQKQIVTMMEKYNKRNDRGDRWSSQPRSQSAGPRRQRSVSRILSAELDSVNEESEAAASDSGAVATEGSAAQLKTEASAGTSAKSPKSHSSASAKTTT
eukprot:8229936-Karenia_brevis.AAC.1